MTGDIRRRRICEVVAQEGFFDVPSLARLFDTSTSTIRRDLQILEQSKLIKRTPGGALPSREDIVLFESRNLLHIEEKEQIGKKVSELIKDGETIFLDAGSTTSRVAKYLLSKHLTVITNGPNICNILQRGKGITIIQTGGKFVPVIQSLVGPIAEEVLKKFNTDKAIIATAGVSSVEGLTNSSLEEVPIKKIAIERAREAIVVADFSKFGKKAATSGIALDHIKFIVTDDKIPGEESARLEEKGIKIIIADGN